MLLTTLYNYKTSKINKIIRFRKNSCYFRYYDMYKKSLLIHKTDKKKIIFLVTVSCFDFFLTKYTSFS